MQAVYGLDAVVQRTAQGDWQQPSPCEGWVALDVVVHNAWAFQLFADMARGIPASVPAPSGGRGVPAPSDDGHVIRPEAIANYAQLSQEYGTDPVGSWNRDRDALLGALDAPGVGEVRTRSPWRETDIDSWLAFAVWDPLVHTWDLAEAVGQLTIVDSDLCNVALDAARTFDRQHDLRRPGVSHAERATSSSDPLDRPLHFAGRGTNWRSRLRGS